MHKARAPENPDFIVSSLADPKKGTKTHIYPANHRYLEGVEE
jgi:hypothetical protein